MKNLLELKGAFLYYSSGDHVSCALRGFLSDSRKTPSERFWRFASSKRGTPPCAAKMDVDTFLETVRRYTDSTTITKRMVAELIEYIEVYPAVKEDGVTNQRVTILYNCIGALEVSDRRKLPERDILMETRKGVALSYAPTQIAI